jgi:hypothetical protein
MILSHWVPEISSDISSGQDELWYTAAGDKTLITMLNGKK